MSGKKRTYGHPRFTPLHLRWLIQLLIAPNFFCSSLFLLQKKWYRHLQGIGGTINCASCLYSPKFVNEATVHKCECISRWLWIAGVSYMRWGHGWDIFKGYCGLLYFCRLTLYFIGLLSLFSKSKILKYC